MANEPLNQLQSGLDNLGETTTAEDLVRQRGGRKLKVMSKKALMDYIQSVVSQVRSVHADKLSEAERSQIEQQAQQKVQEILKRNRDIEQRLKEKEAQRKELEVKLAGGGMDDFDRQLLIGELQQQLADAEDESQVRMQDLLIVEDELNKMQNLYQAALSERDRHNDSNKSFVLRSTALVEGVLGLDNGYYAGRHQEELPPDEDRMDPLASFFHDFQTCAAVIDTLGKDLERLRSITQAGGASAGLLEEDLSLLAQLKEGALQAEDMAAPVESLIEGAEGVRNRLLALGKALGGLSLTFTSLPDPDADPQQVLARLTTNIREYDAAVASCMRAANAGGGNDEKSNRLEATMRQQMIRTAGLVQAMMTLDAQWYQGRFQQAAADDAGDDAEDIFFADFEIVEGVVQELQRDLERLHAMVGSDESKGVDGLLDGLAAKNDAVEPATAEAPAKAGLDSEFAASLASLRDEGEALMSAVDNAAGSAGTTVRIPDPTAGGTAARAAVESMIISLEEERDRISTLKAVDNSESVAEELLQLLAEAAEDSGRPVPEALTDSSLSLNQRKLAARMLLRQLTHLRGSAP